MSLRKKAIAGIRWTTFSLAVKSSTQILQTIILARLLSQNDFGTIVIALTIVAFLQALSDTGISNAIIHKTEISQDELSSLYWINLLFSLLISLFLITSSKYISAFYANNNLEVIITLISIYFPILISSQQFKILAEKNLAFNISTKIEIISSTSSFLVTVFLAYLYKTPIALAIGLLVFSIINLLLSWLWLSKNWKPKLFFSFKSVKPFLGYSYYVVGNNLINTLNSQIDVLIGAKAFPNSSFSSYGLARDISLKVAFFINPIITRVTLPILAKIQHDPEQVKKVYLKTILMTTSVSFPIYLLIFTLSPEIIYLAFGEKWESATPLLQILSLWGMTRAITNPVGSLIYALGKPNLAFKWNLAWMPPTILIFSVSAINSISISVFAIINLIIATTSALLAWRFLINPLSGINFTSYISTIIRPLILALTSAVLTFLLINWIIDPVIKFLLGTMVYGIIYLSLSYLKNKDFLNSAIELIKKSR